MVFIAGIIALFTAFFMTYIYIRNARRPKLEAKITNTFYQHVRNDKKKVGPEHKHAQVTYTHEGQAYESVVLLITKNDLIGDTIVVSYKPTDLTHIDHYAPGKQLKALGALYLVGFALIGLSVLVIDYFELWD